MIHSPYERTLYTTKKKKFHSNCLAIIRLEPGKKACVDKLTHHFLSIYTIETLEQKTYKKAYRSSDVDTLMCIFI